MKSIFSITLVLAFLSRLRFPKNVSLFKIIRERYGNEGLHEYRKFENSDFKLKKAQCDLEFLEKCQTHNLTPKFLEFKLFSRKLNDHSDYWEYQRKLLNSEIESKRDLISSCCRSLEFSTANLSKTLSFLDFNHITSVTKSWNDGKISSIIHKQNRKLQKLGLTVEYRKIPADKLIINLSNEVLSNEQKNALCLGLKFCFNPSRLNYTRYFAAFEFLHNKFLTKKIYEIFPDASNYFSSNLRTIALKYYYSFKPSISLYHRKLISCLRDLSKKTNIVVSRPDKGNGVVILNKTDYVAKMKNILNDPVNFEKISDNIYKIVTKLEDKNNHLVDNLFKKKCISEDQKNKLRSTGSQPGIIYGLPKIHKKDTPLRPILSTIGTPNYNMSKFLVTKLAHLAESDLMVKDSFSFVNEIRSIDNNNYHMASFDIRSLFTNIPLNETCDIILEKIFCSCDVYDGFSKQDMKKMLDNCVKNNLFIFDEELYFQKDGAPMGGCVSPTLANIFLSCCENKWLSECPVDFKPVLFRRYVDDIFLLFRSKTHVIPFLEYLNSKHPRIKFTYENELSNSLPFLDVQVVKSDKCFETSTYYKPTHTGLGLKFNSSITDTYKTGLIKCLVSRAYKINSSYTNFLSEVNDLRKYFLKNSYPLRIINKIIDTTFTSIVEPKEVYAAAPKEKVFVKLPYLSKLSNKNMKNEILDLVRKFYPQIDLKIVFVNKFNIASFFKFKDVVPNHMRSNIVYEFKCSQCSETYIGETTRHLATRVAEHRGVSARTGKFLCKQPNSNIFAHYLKTDHEIVKDDFKILCSDSQHLKISESLLIHQNKPKLNSMTTSVPLKIVGSYF